MELDELIAVLEARDYDKPTATPTERCIWQHLSSHSRICSARERAAAACVLDALERAIAAFITEARNELGGETDE